MSTSPASIARNTARIFEGGALAEDIHLQQQRTQLRHRRQHVVAEDADITANRTDQLDEGDRVDHAQRMIGHDDQRPFDRDVLAFAFGDATTDAEVIQRLLAEFETLRGAGKRQRAIEAIFVGQGFQHADERLAETRVLGQPWHALQQGLIDAQHDLGSLDVERWLPCRAGAES